MSRMYWAFCASVTTSAGPVGVGREEEGGEGFKK